MTDEGGEQNSFDFEQIERGFRNDIEALVDRQLQTPKADYRFNPSNQADTGYAAYRIRTKGSLPVVRLSSSDRNPYEAGNRILFGFTHFRKSRKTLYTISIYPSNGDRQIMSIGESPEEVSLNLQVIGQDEAKIREAQEMLKNTLALVSGRNLESIDMFFPDLG